MPRTKADRKGMTEAQYAAHCGLSESGVHTAKRSGRLVLHDDGSINPAASDVMLKQTTNPVQSASSRSKYAKKNMKPVPKAAVETVQDTIGDYDSDPGSTGTTLVQARLANEILKAQEKKLRVDQLKGGLVDKEQAIATVFQLSREVRDSWVNWPARTAALMASELGVDAAEMQIVLEKYVRQHLDELSDPKPEFR